MQGGEDMKKYKLAITVVFVMLASVMIGNYATIKVQAQEEPEFNVVDGVLKSYSGQGGDVVIPEYLSIEKIDECAFSDVKDSLKSIIILGTVQEIEQGTFSNCVNLERVVLPEGLRCIRAFTFEGCRCLSDFQIPSSVEKIEHYAFKGCDGLKSLKIPSNTVAIDWKAFAECYNLKEVSIPNNEMDIGEYAFYDCANLENVSLRQEGTGECGKEKKIGMGAFQGCKRLRSIQIPCGMIGIDEKAFYDCYELENVEIPYTIKVIGDSAFENCIALKQIVLPEKIETIGLYAFARTSLTSIKLPSGIDQVYDYTFAYTNIKDLVIPKNVTSIRKCAFFIGDLKTVTIPKSVKYIDERAFTEYPDRVLIKCAKNSYAEEYAKKYGFKYKYYDYQTITAVSNKIKKTYGNNPFSLKAKTDGGGKLTYKTSNEKIVKVSSKGKVTIKGCGKATITIIAGAKGTYKEGKKKIEITVRPKKPTIKSLKSNSSKKMTVKWARDKKASGYIIQYSTKEYYSLDHLKTVTISKNSVTSKTIGKLKPGKKYYVKILSYKNVNGKKIKGDWSKQKSVTVKK